MRAILLLLALALSPMGSAAEFDLGPGVGDRIPALEAIDRHGNLRTFENLRGDQGLYLLFFRSADW